MDIERKMVELAKNIEDKQEVEKNQILIDENILKKIQDYSDTEAGHRAFIYDTGEKLSLEDFLVLKGGKTAVIKEIKTILNGFDLDTVKKIYSFLKRIGEKKI